MLTILLIVLLVLILVGSFPAYPYSQGWGYYPSGFVGFILIVLVILLIAGVL